MNTEQNGFPSQNSEGTDQSAIQFAQLKVIYRYLSFGDQDRAESLLESFNTKWEEHITSPGIRIFYNFVLGQSYLLNYNITAWYEDLESSQRCIDRMVETAEANNIHLRSPKYLLLRAMVASKLALASDSLEICGRYYDLTMVLTKVGMRKFPENLCFRDIYESITGQV